MPWKQVRLFEERFKFVQEAEKAERPFRSLCQDYGMSRPTGYKWLERYRISPTPEALQNLSRAPRQLSNKTDPWIAEEIQVTRKRFVYWGPRKLRAWLVREKPKTKWPSSSTIGRILKKSGLVKPPRRRVKTPPYRKPFSEIRASNQLWCVDFKGWIRAGDGRKTYPLTITDAFSRYLLRVEALDKPDGRAVREVLEAVFRDFGLPEAIRSDNGAPFASRGPGGLTELSAWWARLGIRHERIDPGKPQQNGRHERMHLTLKQETCTPPANTLQYQKIKFERFRKQYNEERPHEGIGNQVPQDLYVPSARIYTTDLKRGYFDVFGVDSIPVSRSGTVKWMGKDLKVGKALGGDLVDVRMIQRDRRWSFAYGPVLLGYFDAKKPRADLIRTKKPARV